MDDAENAPAEPRRGGRARKAVERFEPVASKGVASRKRKLDDEEGGSEDSDGPSSDSSDEEGPAASSNRKRAPKGSQRKAPAASGEKAKKPRKKAVTTEMPPTAGPSELEGMKDDSPLFNALLNADIALNAVVEEWVEGYQGAAGDEAAEKEAVHQLILFVIRCCGLLADVDEDEAMDMDGIADVVERIEEESAKVTAAIYPLISRTKQLKPFKPNLNMFISDLIKTLSHTPLLYQSSESTTHSTPLLPLLQSWLHNLSTSALRPLRHTATYMSIKICSALCEVTADVSKDLSMKQRQREAEAKKAGKTAAGLKRVKEAEKKVKEAHGMKVSLEGLMQETVDVVFVHRVRDSDSAIRTDCLKELGVWVKAYPEKFVDRQYLNYFSRGCNDPDSRARSETVKALSTLYTRESFVNNARTVTLRLAPRLIEMALRDVDISVRVRALDVIAHIDKTGILQDEDSNEREKVAQLVFDHEPRIRKAIGGFFAGVWEERVEKLQSEWSGAVGNKKKRGKGVSEEDMTKYLGWKALADLLIETAKAIDEPTVESTEGEERGSAVSIHTLTSRTAAAVEALSGSIECMKDWEGLLDYLLLDHSTYGEDGWLLDDDEEEIMVYLAIALIRADPENNEDERTKTLMQVLPRLITKNQSDVPRMTAILGLPSAMKLESYLDMRKSAAYDSLWDDISKQFLTQTDPVLLTSAMTALNTLSANTSLSSNNLNKSVELTEALFSSLRDALDGEDVSDLQLGDEQIAGLEAIMLRLSLLQRSRDLVDVMEDTEGGQSAGWDIVCEFVARGEVGYKEERKLVEYAMQVVFLHLTWLFQRFAEEDANDETKVEALVEKRDRLIKAVKGLALAEQSNAAESVRRQAFICFLNAYVLFSPKSTAPAAKAAFIKMEDETQHRLGGSFQAMVDRYDSDLEEVQATQAEDAAEVAQLSPAQTFEFHQLVSVFVAAIRTGVLEVEHAKEPLAHYGRFGSTYDAIVKKLVDVLRDEGIYNRDADTVQHVAGSALQNSFNTYLDSEDSSDPTATLSLAKLVSSVFVIHGTHFTIMKQLAPSDVYDFHLSSIDYITRKVSTFIKQERANKDKTVKTRIAAKRSRAMAGWFKVLVPLLGPVGGRDALKLKSHMEEALGDAGVTIRSGRGWEGYKIYEKRLVGIAGRDQGVKEASKKVVSGGRKGKVVKAMDKEVEEEEDEGEEREITRTASPDLTENEGAKWPTPSPIRPATAKFPAAAPEDEEEAEEDAPAPASPAEEDAVDLTDLILDLDQDLDFADADFGDLNSSQGGRGAPGSSQKGGRARSESVEAESDLKARGTKRRKVGKVF